MTIELITQEEYDRLLAIQKEYPNLTFQNQGYSYPKKSDWSQEDLNAFKEVEDIVKKSIVGFQELNHFTLKKDGSIRIRFQYDWTADDRSQGIPFTGVGYIEVDELFNGFKTNDYETVS